MKYTTKKTAIEINEYQFLSAAPKGIVSARGRHIGSADDTKKEKIFALSENRRQFSGPASRSRKERSVVLSKNEEESAAQKLTSTVYSNLDRVKNECLTLGLCIPTFKKNRKENVIIYEKKTKEGKQRRRPCGLVVVVSGCQNLAHCFCFCWAAHYPHSNWRNYPNTYEILSIGSWGKSLRSVFPFRVI